MSNMSYCRFQNTLRDLRDCKDALEEVLLGQTEPLSDDELRAAKALVSTALEMVLLVAEDTGRDVGDLDGSAAEDALEAAVGSANSLCSTDDDDDRGPCAVGCSCDVCVAHRDGI